MKTPIGIAGVMFVWAGALEWTYEYWNNMWPSGIFIILLAIGSILVLLECGRMNNWRPFAWATLAAIVPSIALWGRGFRI
jgi:hypothetical protein